jgi:hypothetical protein
MGLIDSRAAVWEVASGAGALGIGWPLAALLNSSNTAMPPEFGLALPIPPSRGVRHDPTVR